LKFLGTTVESGDTRYFTERIAPLTGVPESRRH